MLTIWYDMSLILGEAIPTFQQDQVRPNLVQNAKSESGARQSPKSHVDPTQ